MTSRNTVLLDTNVWSYLAASDGYSNLRSISKKYGFTIVIAPAVVYESLAIPQPDKRARVVDLLVRKFWLRLLPEAFCESEELLMAMRQLRPSWILKNPDLGNWKKNHLDWRRKKGGFWDRIQTDQNLMAELTRSPLLEPARLAAIRARKDFEKVSPKQWAKGLPFAKPTSDTPGWKGDPISLWRVQGRDVTYAHLSQRDNPYQDWLLPFLDISKITEDEWNTFWFYEVADRQLRRFWIRTAVEWLQRFRKVSPGTPGDSQLSAHLIDAEFVVSADGIFCDIVADVARLAAFNTASPVRVSAGASGVSDLFDWMGRTGGGSR